MDKKMQAELTVLETYYKESPEVEAQNQKSKQANAILLPLLKQIFNEKDKDGNDIRMVKLREEFGGSMLTYAINRMIVEKDTEALKTGLLAAGVKILDSSANGITASQGVITMVITLRVADESKAIIDVTL